MLPVSASRWVFALALLAFAGCKDKTPKPSAALTYTVSTLAGTNGLGSYADGTGRAAAFNSPRGLAVDAQGNVYVADSNNQRIRKVSPAGVATTIAGSGPTGSQQGGYADGPAAQALFSQPCGVAVDAQGNVYVADMGNYRVRKISAAGQVSTVAGSGVRGFADGPAATAEFGMLSGVAVDAQGNVYVADGDNYRIRKISPAGQVSTLAGSGVAGHADGPGATAQFQYIPGLSLDAQGNVFVADLQNHCIRKVSPAGVVTTVAGSGTEGFADGAAATAKFDGPADVAVDAAGTLYVTDGENYRIRKVSPAGEVSTLAGTGQPGFGDGPAGTATFILPVSIASSAQGTVFVTQQVGYQIRRIQKD